MSASTDDRALAVLRERFGHDEFLPGQRRVIDHLVAGRSALAIFPTGGGKSLCYQLPSLLFDGLTLVVSPLIALMKDQIDSLAALGVRAARLDSSLSAAEVAATFDDVRAGDVRLLYVAPERFLNERFLATIRSIPIALFAVDEAHCISEWGHNFRPDYLKLAAFAKEIEAERVLALTATATPAVERDIASQFAIVDEARVRTGFYRANLRLLATPTTERSRDKILLERLREREPGPTIVYVTLQRTAEEVARRLSKAGFESLAYHAGLESEERSRIQDTFMASDRAIVVATIAFGMGIDKSDIRQVYHYNLPKSLEGYSQEIGRAGRDGLPSVCELLACTEDLRALESFAYGDTPDPADVRALIESLVSDAVSGDDEFDASVHELSGRFDIRVLVVRTILTYLELDGLLIGGTPFYAGYQFIPLVTSRELLARFDEERAAFLSALLRRVVKKQKWMHVDVEAIAGALAVPRERIVAALDELDLAGLIELRTASVRNRFRWRVDRKTVDVDALVTRLNDALLDRERREIARLRQVLALVQHDGCQVSALGAHFGEPLDTDCGHCSWCESRSAAGGPAPREAGFEDPESAPAEIDAAKWAAAVQVREAHPEALGANRAFARFLAGVPSPRLTRAKLTRHALFGALGEVPFAQVLEAISATAD